ncbi:DUF6165 family protein [Xylella fastidiosa subsp. morus]|uniref:DUF6165 family protein n=1 Tax=Xylella fastidiosa subsp. multiplex TaxID=644357 RepID=A0A9Q4QSB4_XYLFS|nr:DUF6165 family protein [Xylella fastidiosa]ERI59742.1 hypothetical protein M233_07810 [Xylella fastidiosa subsp. multiplex Griffin-1]ACA12289.1 conserved hypothetical protein [Xylella fastidiosa M12]EWG13596.1 hypothetical protein P910_003139 [Xylella fastidiosa Mul-MD]KAJ4852666.1 DUF6165 family protein [Xylella fastidiosa subsp. multiplex]KFA40315.1 hypothetical protein DF22_003096 [Xylella fastidiosa]
MSGIFVPVSFGELLDKIAILQIKSERITDVAKLVNVRNELSALEKIWMAYPTTSSEIPRLRTELKAVNERLWGIEDEIRLKEKAQTFDKQFIHLARSVYFENDERARIKKEINLALDSPYVEEKSYQDYRSAETL